MLPGASAEAAAIRPSAGGQPWSVGGWWNGDQPRSGPGAHGPVWSPVLGHGAANAGVALAAKKVLRVPSAGEGAAAGGGGTCLTEGGEKVKVFVSLLNSIVIKARGLVWGNHFFSLSGMRYAFVLIYVGGGCKSAEARCWRLDFTCAFKIIAPDSLLAAKRLFLLQKAKYWRSCAVCINNLRN